MIRHATASLRATLLRWLLVPTVIVLPLNALHSYRDSVAIANAAYDRSLLLSARSIAERMQVSRGRLLVELPYAAIDMTETGLGAHVYHRIEGPDGRVLSGDDDFPAVPPQTPLSPAYPALVRFYDARHRGLAVRAVALHHPISEERFSGMALVQVAETLEARDILIRHILVRTVLVQLLLLALAVGLILVAVKRGLAPLDALRRNAQARTVRDLTPFDATMAPAETRSFVDALNRYIARLAELNALRKRFIENAAHQLRTPIAVLKTQLALAQRERDPQALQEVVDAMGVTADSAARLANQLLSLTRAEHGPGVNREAVDLVALGREVCLDLAPRAVAGEIDLGFESGVDGAATIDGDAVLLHEMLVNVIDNALKYAGSGEHVTVRVGAEPGVWVLIVDDSGPGIPEDERNKVLRRFHRVPGQDVPGSGLGLAIVEETALQHGGRVGLHRSPYGGLRVRIEFPLPATAAP